MHAQNAIINSPLGALQGSQTGAEHDRKKHLKGTQFHGSRHLEQASLPRCPMTCQIFMMAVSASAQLEQWHGLSDNKSFASDANAGKDMRWQIAVRQS